MKKIIRLFNSRTSNDNSLRIIGGATNRLYHDLCNKIKRLKFLLLGAKVGRPVRLRRLKLTGGSWSFVEIDDFATIGNVNIYALGRVYIGKNALVIDNTRIITGEHDIDDKKYSLKKNSVIIEDYCFIGEGAVLLPGAHIEYGAVVGAYCVVSKRIPSMAVVIGNPCKIIKYRKNIHSEWDPFNPNGKSWLQRLSDLWK